MSYNVIDVIYIYIWSVHNVIQCYARTYNVIEDHKMRYDVISCGIYILLYKPSAQVFPVVVGLFSTDAWEIVKPWLRFLVVRSFRQKGIWLFCIPDATWEEDHGYSWSCATWDHQSLCLQPPNASVLATFKTLLCILGAWFATSSRWMTMCNLPAGIAASWKAMHDFNLGSGFETTRPASQQQGCYDSTDPVCSPLPGDSLYRSCKRAFNELRASSSIPLLGVLETTWSSTRQWLYELWAGSETWG